MGLLTGPHQTSFSELSSFTIRLSSGERPVFAPEYAVSAPVEVMADPVSYTRASSYRAATEGLAIYRSIRDRSRNILIVGVTHDRYAIVINVCDLVQFFFDFCVLSQRPTPL